MAVSVKYASILSAIARPANTTAYVIGQAIGNVTSAAGFTPFQWAVPTNVAFDPVGIRLRKSGPIVTNANFRMHLFSAAPVVTVAGDGAAVATDVAGSASWVASFDGTMVSSFNDGATGLLVPNDGTGIIVPALVAPGSLVYGILEAKAAYSPLSQEIFAAALICRLQQ